MDSKKAKGKNKSNEENIENETGTKGKLKDHAGK